MPSLDRVGLRRGGSAWLTDRRFLAIFVVGTLTSLVRWLEMLVFGVYVYAETGSATVTAAHDCAAAPAPRPVRCVRRGGRGPESTAAG